MLTGVGALQISRRAAIAAGGTALVAPIFAPARGSAAGIAKASKVVVVGGDGFIGSRAVQELLALQPGLTVVSLSRRHLGVANIVSLVWKRLVPQRIWLGSGSDDVGGGLGGALP